MALDKDFENDPEEYTESGHKKTAAFDDMNLKPTLIRGVYAYGFERPSSIQQCAIMPILDGQDVIAQASYGAGKTATLVISILQKVKPDLKACQTLILAPSRELVMQTQEFIVAIGDFMNIRCGACVGGVSVLDNEKVLRDAPPVVVGTPGRLKDMIQRDILKTANIETLVLDEADEIIARGFADQIYDIFHLLSKPVQVLVTSTTMPQDLLEATGILMRKPRHIYITKKDFRLEGIKQFYVNVEKDEYKLEAFLHLCASITTFQTITFCNTRKKTEWLKEKINVPNLPFYAMHGDMPAFERAEIMKQFRSGSAKLLIATEFLARGIDVQQIPLVINYDLHANYEGYVHRVGRSGRFGRNGAVVNLVTSDDTCLISKIEDFYNTEIEETTLDNLMLYLMEQEWAKIPECEIRVISLRDDEKVSSYEALSYCWGSPQGTIPIYCVSSPKDKDKKQLLVTPSCFDALVHLRNRLSKRTIWIDAICIDQTSAQDKAQQVPMMAEESRDHAACVGVESHDQLAYGDERYGDRDSKWGQPVSGYGNDTEYLAAIRGMFEVTPWFTRVWTLQEVAFARKCTVMCGRLTKNWAGLDQRLMSDINKLPGDLMYHLNLLESKTLASRLVKGGFDSSLVDSAVNFFGNGYFMPLTTRKKTSVDRAELTQLLYSIRNFQCTNFHDKVFAIYGILGAVLDIDVAAELPAVDYSRPVAEIFALVSTACTRSLKSLDLIILTLPPSTNGGCSAFPSWVPDWLSEAKWSSPKLRYRNGPSFDIEDDSDDYPSSAPWPGDDDGPDIENSDWGIDWTGVYLHCPLLSLRFFRSRSRASRNSEPKSEILQPSSPVSNLELAVQGIRIGHIKVAYQSPPPNDVFDHFDIPQLSGFINACRDWCQLLFKLHESAESTEIVEAAYQVHHHFVIDSGRRFKYTFPMSDFLFWLALMALCTPGTKFSLSPEMLAHLFRDGEYDLVMNEKRSTKELSQTYSTTCSRL
ncbi:ATP-dependent RNA helicase eIF4A [Colletotrichum fructicola]|nr:ATP-dependent RNA helicase eIF4A [Colletotrichum fructicola]